MSEKHQLMMADVVAQWWCLDQLPVLVVKLQPASFALQETFDFT